MHLIADVAGLYLCEKGTPKEEKNNQSE
jgi:hypothetical protein